MEIDPLSIEKSYTCSFCKRGFSNAQALGGHMNIHRKDRARLKESSNETLLPDHDVAKKNPSDIDHPDHDQVSVDDNSLQLKSSDEEKSCSPREDGAISRSKDCAGELLQLPLFVEMPSTGHDLDASSRVEGHVEKSLRLSSSQMELDLELRLGPEPHRKSMAELNLNLIHEWYTPTAGVYELNFNGAFFSTELSAGAPAKVKGHRSGVGNVTDKVGGWGQLGRMQGNDYGRVAGWGWGGAGGWKRGGRCTDDWLHMAGVGVRLDSEETNISHILFGIGGSAKTWNDRRKYSELWWKPNMSRGFVWLDEKPAADMTWLETSPPYKVSEDSSRFKYTSWYGSRSAVRIARIVKESFQLGLENVRWFVLGDDDTVFFTENLVTVLAKYDHNQMYYIGGNSESVEQDVIHSYSMAYGGGGFAISYPLAAELVRVLDGCIDRYASFYGSDQKIQGCMSEIGVPVTKELGFHQVDIRGDLYGLLAAHPLAPLVSLHHLDYVQPAFPGLTQIDSLKKLVQAYKTDPGRVLQHSFCYDLRRKWSVSVSWGYTIQLYPSLVTAKELETAFQTFVTWRSWRHEPFTFNTRIMSPDPCGKPLIYFFDGVEGGETGQNHTITTYKRHLDGPGKGCDQKEYVPALSILYFNVSAAKFEADTWKKAPRRQCCEIVNGEDGVDGVVQIKIRGCNQWESVTPP
ncbi:hypothetical protein F0562_016287 [Nyssa sinensis]|uniref:C2H2-type domain-containing protein n=1 Tax=Nyssa sinensis TaxID=561372 RepID=A0A5J4ZLY1_9ASTE|nr:hypothetical protein F0562_016287 [Nyssa sinensis]